MEKPIKNKGGRPKGSKTRSRKSQIAKAIGLQDLRCNVEKVIKEALESPDMARRDKMAIAVMPYIYPRLQTVEHKGDVKFTPISISGKYDDD